MDLALLLLLTGALTVTAAVIDWWAVGTGRLAVEAVAKPAVMVGLLGLAAALMADGDPARPLSSWVRFCVLFGVLLGLVGDVLLLPQVDRFVPGLVAFLLGHLAYSAAFVGQGLHLGAGMTGLAMATALIVGVGRPILRAVRRGHPSLVVPVACYLMVTGLVITCAVGAVAAPVRPGPVLAVLGALLFAGSDAVLGWGRFVRELPGQRLLVMVPYHVGQALLVIGLLLPLSSAAR